MAKVILEDILVYKVSLPHNVSFLAQKGTHYVSFWIQKIL